MSVFDVILVSLVAGASLWTIATAWEEYNRKDLSDITLSSVAISLFFLWLVIVYVL